MAACAALAGLALCAPPLALSSGLQTEQTRRIVERFGVTQTEAVAYQVLWVARPEWVPELIRGEIEVPLKGTTPLLFRLRARIDELPADLRQKVQLLYNRPPASLLPESYVSEKGHFRIHFTLSGRHATTMSMVETIAQVFEHCWEIEVDSLKFRPPPSDFGVDGPEYDIYVMDIGDYGYTNADREIPETPQDDWTSFIVVDNDFQNPRYYTKGVPALKVTAAHEFFHAIHFGYRSFRQDDVFYYEASGTWMEDYVYDEVNDYYQYLPAFFDRPDRPFDTYDGWHEYGLALWNKMLCRLYGVGVVRRIWEQMVEMSAIDAMDAVLREEGDTFERALAEFQVWNYFTGSRADTLRFYRDGADFPELRFNHDLEIDSVASLSDSARNLAGTFLHFHVAATGSWTASFDFELPTMWACGVAVWNQDGGHWAETPPSGSDLNIGTLGRTSTFLIVPVNIRRQSEWGDDRLRFHVRVQRQAGESRWDFRVYDPAPNLFRPRRDGFAAIQFQLDRASDVRVIILDSAGRVVREERLGEQPEGLRRIYRWDGRNQRGELVASGVYLVQVVAGGKIGLTKIAVLR